MTTITSNSAVGIVLSTPSFINPVTIIPGVAISSGTIGIYATMGTWNVQNSGGITGSSTCGLATFPNAGVKLIAGGTLTNLGSISGFDGFYGRGGRDDGVERGADRW